MACEKNALPISGESTFPHTVALRPPVCARPHGDGDNFNYSDAATVPDPTSIPRKDVIIDGMSKRTIFVSMDLLDGSFRSKFVNGTYHTQQRAPLVLNSGSGLLFHKDLSIPLPHSTGKANLSILVRKFHQATSTMCLIIAVYGRDDGCGSAPNPFLKYAYNYARS